MTVIRRHCSTNASKAFIGERGTLDSIRDKRPHLDDSLLRSDNRVYKT